MPRVRRVENETETELNIARAAQFLEVSVASVRNFRKRNQLPGSYQIHTVTGDAWVVPMEDLRKLKAERAARLSSRAPSRADNASSARTPATDGGKDARTLLDKNADVKSGSDGPMSEADLARVVRAGGGVQGNGAEPVQVARGARANSDQSVRANGDDLSDETLAMHGIEDQIEAVREAGRAADHLKAAADQFKRALAHLNRLKG
jgi:hypothetical protein